MALNVQKGTVAAPAATGNQTISLASNFDPKAIIVWTTGQTADARLNANGRLGYGFGTYRGAAVQQNYQTAFSVDNGTSSSCAWGANTTAMLKLFSAVTPTVAINVSLVSMSLGATSNVILNFVTTLSGAVIHYMILGGSDIADAQAGNFTTSTAVATQDVTIAAGFGQPDLMMFHTTGHTGNADTGANNICQGFGFAKSDTERWFSAFVDTTAAATMVCGATQRAVALIAMGGTTSVESEADLSAKANWPTDGFQLSYGNQAASLEQVYYLALKGTFTSTVGNTTIPTAGAPQTQNLALASGTPVGALFVDWPGPTQAASVVDTTHADLGGLMLGGTDGTNEGCAGWTQDDGNASAATGVTHSTAKVFQGVTADSTLANPPILNSEADASISGSNVVMTWSDTDTVARAYGYVLFGQSAGLETTVSDSATTADAQAFDFGEAVADSTAPADARALGFGPAASDTLSPTDGLATEVGKSASPSDSVTPSDAQALGFGPAAADTSVPTDARALGFGPGVVDSAASSDVQALGVGQSAADAATPTDAQSLGVGQSAADSVAATDGTAQETGKATSVADSVTSTDGTTQATGKGVSPADSVTATDAVSRGFGAGINDSLTPTDSLVAAAGYVQAVNDTTALADSLTTAQGYAISASDATAISDAITASIGRAVSFADSLTALDAVRFDVGRAVADATAIADAQSRGIGVGQADVLVVVDNTASSIALALADVLTVTDEVTAGQGAPYIHTLLPQDGLVVPAALSGLVFLVVAAGTVTVVDASGIVASFAASGSPLGAQASGNVTPGTTGGSGDGYEGEGAQV